MQRSGRGNAGCWPPTRGAGPVWQMPVELTRVFGTWMPASSPQPRSGQGRQMPAQPRREGSPSGDACLTWNSAQRGVPVQGTSRPSWAGEEERRDRGMPARPGWRGARAGMEEVRRVGRCRGGVDAGMGRRVTCMPVDRIRPSWRTRVTYMSVWPGEAIPAHPGLGSTRVGIRIRPKSAQQVIFRPGPPF